MEVETDADVKAEVDVVVVEAAADVNLHTAIPTATALTAAANARDARKVTSLMQPTPTCKAAAPITAIG